VHDKGRLVDLCTVNSHCRAPSPPTHGEKSLSCVMDRARQKKVTHGARVANGVDWGFAVRREQNARQRFCLCRAPTKKRMTKNWPLPCALLKRTANPPPFPCAAQNNARQRSYASCHIWPLCRASAIRRMEKGPMFFFFCFRF
jgi:hypothetical protein